MTRGRVLAAALAIFASSALPASVSGAGVTSVEHAASAGAPASRDRVQSFVIGHSVLGRDIVAHRMGTRGKVVLVIGNTHGNEPKGVDVGRALRIAGPPSGIELWVVDTINPDGLAAGTRTNARGVDLNRNFAYNWGYIAVSPSHDQYSGEAPADQPETQSVQNLITLIQPQITVWYHQDANRVSVGGRRPELALEYARLVGQSTADTPCSRGCTGTGTQFANHTVASGTAFLVELPGNDAVTQSMVDRHAEALLVVMQL